MKKTNKNAPCPCGSGNKYKQCCFLKDRERENVGKRRKLILAIASGFTLISILTAVLIYNAFQPGPYDELAICLSDKGYVMYGTNWCDNCSKQKSLFGKSFKHINYVECNAGGGISNFCKEKGIQKIPTWVTPDGEKLLGVQYIAELEAHSSCDISYRSTTDGTHGSAHSAAKGERHNYD